MKSPVKIDVGAKAEAKLSIKGEIPKKSLGQFVDSITDIFRPFSEARGLVADQIRLQREDVAIEIAKRARARLAIEEMTASPVDAKILIPLIEKSSLEDISDNEMIDRWSSLLANATIKDKVEPRYVQILSELNSRQATLFEKIALFRWDEVDSPNFHLENAPFDLNKRVIRHEINKYYESGRSTEPFDVTSHILSFLMLPGCMVIDIIILCSGGDFHSLTDTIYNGIRYDNIDIDLAILKSLGLVDSVDIDYAKTFSNEISVHYFGITELGVAFFSSVDRRLVKNISD